MNMISLLIFRCWNTHSYQFIVVSEDTFYPRIDIDKIITQENNFDVIDV